VEFVGVDDGTEIDDDEGIDDEDVEDMLLCEVVSIMAVDVLFAKFEDRLLVVDDIDNTIYE